MKLSVITPLFNSTRQTEKFKYVIQEGQFTQLKNPQQAVTEEWPTTPGVQHSLQNAVSACEAKEKH